VNQLLSELKIEQHPDKTTIGPIDRGFDFLGYHLTRRGGDDREELCTRTPAL